MKPSCFCGNKLETKLLMTAKKIFPVDCIIILHNHMSCSMNVLQLNVCIFISGFEMKCGLTFSQCKHLVGILVSFEMAFMEINLI